MRKLVQAGAAGQGGGGIRREIVYPDSRRQWGPPRVDPECRPFVFNNILALFGKKRILPKLALGVKSRGSGHLDWVYPPKAEIAPRHCQALFHSKRQLVPLPLSSKKYASILAYAQALVKHKNPLVLS
jgi:hypothetical protein